MTFLTIQTGNFCQYDGHSGATSATIARSIGKYFQKRPGEIFHLHKLYSKSVDSHSTTGTHAVAFGTVYVSFLPLCAGTVLEAYECTRKDSLIVYVLG